MTFPGPVGRGPEFLGTRLRYLVELLEGEIKAVYADLGLADFRPRFTSTVRTLAANGPSSISEIAAATGVTHSAASQTVAQMRKAGLVTLAPGPDARQRIAHLTPAAKELVPVLNAEWAATTAAAEALEAELSAPLSRIVEEALAALHRRPMRQRIADAAPDLFGDSARPADPADPADPA